MRHNRTTAFVISLSAAASACLVFTFQAKAEMFYDVEVKTIYEDNVTGLLSDQRTPVSMPSGATVTAAGFGPGGGSGGTPPYLGSSTQSNGDFSVMVAADLGGSTDLNADTLLFAKAQLQHSSYSTYQDLDSTIAGAAAGITRQLGTVLSARLTAAGRLKAFGDSQRNSTGYSGILELKQRITPLVWFREGYEYERNNADTALFSYTGNSVWAGLGYGLSDTWTLSLGYTYLVREYEEPAGFKITSHSVSTGIRKELSRTWHVAAGYERAMSTANSDGARSTNNIYSVSVLYWY
jgi:hypothetical protein